MKKEQQQADDRHIRDGLNSLRPSAPAGGWEQLVQRMEAASPTEAEDELLRDKLTAIVPPYAASSWDSLNERLESEPLQADEIVSEKLKGLTPAYEPDSWDILNDRLNNQESDEIFLTKIDTHATVPAVSGWAALAAKLELIAARRAAVYSYKFSELCLVLAALMLFWHAFPTQDAVPTTNLPLAIESADKAPVFSFAPAEVVPTVAVPMGEPTIEDEIDYAELQLGALVAPLPVREFPAAQPQWTLPAANTSVKSPGLAAAVAPLPTLAYRLNDKPDRLPAPPANLNRVSPKTPKKLYLRPFISPWDFNQVITPKQAVNDIILERDNRISYGRSAGVLLDVQYRKHAMQYGLIYSHRSYIPTVLKEVEEFVPGQGAIERRDTNYSRISFQTVSFPVSYQHELVNNGRWRVAASAGLAVNLNIWATFKKSPTFDHDVLNWSRQSAPPPFGPRSPGAAGLPVIDARDLVYPEQGLLQGGSLLSNIHLSATFGFSIERYLNDRMSVYLAPQLSRSLYYQDDSGAEPFNDRIHNSSVQFGTRILLGQRK